MWRVDRLRSRLDGLLPAGFIACNATGRRGGMARLPRVAGFALAGRSRRRRTCGRRRVQRHLQLGHDRPAQGYRAHAPAPPRLGLRPRASRCATTAARARSARSACTRTSAGSASSARCSPVARSSYCVRSSRGRCSRRSSASASRTVRWCPLQFQRILELPDFDRYDTGSLQSLMCCGSPLVRVAQGGRDRQRIALRTNRALWPDRGPDHDAGPEDV